MADAAPLLPGAARAVPRARGGTVLLRVRGDLTAGPVLRRDLLLALADDPPALVCDLSPLSGPLPAAAVEALVAVGRQSQLWPGTPVAVVHPGPGDRSALTGGPLLLAEALHPALVAVRAHPGPQVARVQLPPHPVAPRAARDFLVRTCTGWGTPGAVDTGCLAISELVTAAVTTSTRGIDVSVRRAGGHLALAVRGAGHPAPPGPVVRALSRATGILEARDGQVVTWTVLAR